MNSQTLNIKEICILIEDVRYKLNTATFGNNIELQKSLLLKLAKLTDALETNNKL